MPNINVEVGDEAFAKYNAKRALYRLTPSEFIEKLILDATKDLKMELIKD